VDAARWGPPTRHRTRKKRKEKKKRRSLDFPLDPALIGGLARLFESGSGGRGGEKKREPTHKKNSHGSRGKDKEKKKRKVLSFFHCLPTVPHEEKEKGRKKK